MQRRDRQSYKRQKATKKPVRRFYLVCEGQNTEPSYFDALKRELGHLQIEFHYTKGAGDPSAIARKADEIATNAGLKKASRKKLSSFEEADQVWVIFDRDEHAHYESAKADCQRNGIGVAYSDPCFELWLNLHFQDCDAPCCRTTAQRITEKLFKGYSRKEGKVADFTEALKNLNYAENRAERQCKNRVKEDNEAGNPSTSVYLLTRSIKIASQESKG